MRLIYNKKRIKKEEFARLFNIRYHLRKKLLPTRFVYRRKTRFRYKAKIKWADIEWTAFLEIRDAYKSQKYNDFEFVLLDDREQYYFIPPKRNLIYFCVRHNIYYAIILPYNL